MDPMDSMELEPPVAVSGPLEEFASYAAGVAKTFGVTFAFSPQVVPASEGSAPVEVRLSTDLGVAFPFEMQQLAFVLPNSAFESVGASWGKVAVTPKLKVNRTMPSSVGGIEVPPHDMAIGEKAVCLLSFHNLALQIGTPPPAGTLHEKAAFAFASKFLERFQWLADEGNAGERASLFQLARRTLELKKRKITPILKPVESPDGLIPHEIRLSDIDYSKIAQLQNSNTEFTMGMDKFNRSLSSEEAAVAWSENPTAQKIVVDRLNKWIESESETMGKESRRNGLLNVVLAHEFNFSDPTTRTLMTVGIVFFRPKPHEPPKNAAGLVQKLRKVADSYDYPTILSKMQLYQRFRKLISNDGATELLQKAVSKKSDSKKFDLFFKSCSEYGLLPLLVEFVIVLKRLCDDAAVPPIRFEEAADSRGVAAKDEILNLFENIRSRVGASPKIMSYMDERLGWDLNDARWTNKGGLPPSRATLSIKLTAEGGQSLGPTPPTWNAFQTALNEALRRLQIDPPEL